MRSISGYLVKNPEEEQIARRWRSVLGEIAAHGSLLQRWAANYLLACIDAHFNRDI